MIESLLRKLAQQVTPTGRLTSALSAADINSLKGYLSNSRVISQLTKRYATARDDQNKMTNKLTVKLGETSGWTAALTTHSFHSDNIHSAPCPWLTFLISEDHIAEIAIYCVKSISIVDPIGARALLLHKLYNRTLAAWEPWEGNDYDTLFTITSAACGSVWLNLIGPCISPYVHAYDERTSAYVYSSFSDQNYTGNDFICRMLKEYLYEGENLCPEGQSLTPTLEALVDQLWNNPSTAITSKWMLAQALHKIDPLKGKIALENIASLDSGLKASALNQLAEMNYAR